MQNRTFDKIWNDTIEISNELFDGFSQELKSETQACIKDDKKKLVFDEYNRIKAHFKKNYYKNKKKDLICHHKIASSYCSALIRHKVVRFDLKEVDVSNLEVQKLCQINYKIAFLSGLSIVYNFMIDYYMDNEKEEELEFVLKYFTNSRMLEFPIVNDTHDNFIDGIVKMLAIRDLQSDKFDILGFSYIYFFVEEYNKSLIKEKYKKEPLKNQ